MGTRRNARYFPDVDRMRSGELAVIRLVCAISPDNSSWHSLTGDHSSRFAVQILWSIRAARTAFLRDQGLFYMVRPNSLRSELMIGMTPLLRNPLRNRHLRSRKPQSSTYSPLCYPPSPLRDHVPTQKVSKEPTFILELQPGCSRTLTRTSYTLHPPI